MKVLFLTNLYPPNVYGGYERLCYEVAQALQERGHDVTVLTSSYGKSCDENYGHNVKRELFLFATEGNMYEPFNCAPEQRVEREASNRRVFEAVVEEVNPDVLFVWNLYFFNPGLLWLIEKSGIRKTYLLTDNWMIALLNAQFIGDYFSNKVFRSHGSQDRLIAAIRRFARPIIRILTNKVFLMNGRAIFPSQFMRHLYRDAGFRFRDRDAICYHGVHFLHSQDIKRISRLELRSTSELRLLFAGRVVRIKGVHTAIEALNAIRARFVDIRVLLTIVGDTQDSNYYNEIEQLIDSLGVRDCIAFRPPVASEKLFDLFQEHDIYLFPSLYEPFSLTLIHALESGIPTIASDAGGNVEIVEDGKTGLVFRAGDYDELAEKIYSLVVQPDLRENLSRMATALAAEFTFEGMISRIETELKKEAR